MKYENFEQAEKIVSQIDDLKILLDAIENENCKGTLSNHNGYAHMNFYQKDDNSKYHKLFLNFYDGVKSTINHEIMELKEALLTL